MAETYMDNQVSIARLRNARIPERKARFVVDLIRGKSVGEALAILAHLHRPSAAPQVERLLKSAVANVDRGEHPDTDDLVVGRAWVDGGAIMWRWQPRAMGRAARIRKRSCHVTIVLAAENED